VSRSGITLRAGEQRATSSVLRHISAEHGPSLSASAPDGGARRAGKAAPGAPRSFSIVANVSLPASSNAPRSRCEPPRRGESPDPDSRVLAWRRPGNAPAGAFRAKFFSASNPTVAASIDRHESRAQGRSRARLRFSNHAGDVGKTRNWRALLRFGNFAACKNVAANFSRAQFCRAARGERPVAAGRGAYTQN
jgi:hypothetical protein